MHLVTCNPYTFFSLMKALIKWMGVCMCLCVLSCLMLWDPTDRRPPGPSIHRVFQTRILEWVATSYSSIKWIEASNLKADGSLGNMIWCWTDWETCRTPAFLFLLFLIHCICTCLASLNFPPFLSTSIGFYNERKTVIQMWGKPVYQISCKQCRT